MLSGVPHDGTPEAVTPRGPLDDATIARCFAGLESAETLLLAVSGGPDSLALLLLATRWAAGAGPSLYVATVDHALRPDARAEAELVAAVAAEHGLPHEILVWAGPKPASRIQERARAARYGLLADHARAIGASHVLTAHHADDQAETVLLRLGRGSGLSGLAGMRRLSPLAAGITLVRPLLDLSKADLVATCRAAGCRFVEDPSNLDPAYARARLRRQAPALARLGLDNAGLTRLARRLARADEALDREADRQEALLQPVRRAGAFEIELSPARDIASEIQIRLLRHAVTHVSGDAPIRLERLENLAEAVWAALGERRAHRATLAGARIVLSPAGTLQVTVAPARRRGVVKVTSVP